MQTQQRFDFEVIARWVSPGETVLDLGCGDGSLLAFLRDTRGVKGYGVEADPERVVACVRNDVNVLQIDMEKGLADFQNAQFDHVIMSLSLQAVHHTEKILDEMLRVGREAVVSFPNFGYWKHRQAILNGRMPVSESLPFEWYDTPNVRFFTIADFEALCEARGIRILERAAFDDDKPVIEEPNFLASMAMYRLAR
ncbi:methionine biosynthesis protein MetW [Niveibacterium sp. 24ML]|uniref:methionine biosynthesis protein MetW n=1 Tax=Niveibacterium sp. 24ML TaxID=2985512 RepID=UPI00226FE1B7|nr:methionine biosynthesis protein MetW [Niveibacterium sp. 24ML]MCX9157580.1 methionine biosynthesis protein MetW [Niveibacterium sp. 24ML]